MMATRELSLLRQALAKSNSGDAALKVPPSQMLPSPDVTPSDHFRDDPETRLLTTDPSAESLSRSLDAAPERAHEYPLSHSLPSLPPSSRPAQTQPFPGIPYPCKPDPSPLLLPSSSSSASSSSSSSSKNMAHSLATPTSPAPPSTLSPHTTAPFPIPDFSATHTGSLPIPLSTLAASTPATTPLNALPPPPAASPFSSITNRAEIVGYEIQQLHSKKYAAFHVLVQALEAGQLIHSWSIWRRYSDFYLLDENLQKTFPHLKLPHFPPKRFFGSSIAASHLFYRQTKLNKYLEVLFRHFELSHHPMVLQFFEIKSSFFKHTHSSLDPPVEVGGAQNVMHVSPQSASPPLAPASLHLTTPTTPNALTNAPTVPQHHATRFDPIATEGTMDPALLIGLKKSKNTTSAKSRKTLSTVRLKTTKFIRKVSRAHSAPNITIPHTLSMFLKKKRPMSTNKPIKTKTKFSTLLSNNKNSKSETNLNLTKSSTVATSSSTHPNFVASSPFLAKKWFDMPKFLSSKPKKTPASATALDSFPSLSPIPPLHLSLHFDMFKKNNFQKNKPIASLKQHAAPEDAGSGQSNVAKEASTKQSETKLKLKKETSFKSKMMKRRKELMAFLKEPLHFSEFEDGTIKREPSISTANSEASSEISVPGIKTMSPNHAKICLDDFELLHLLGKGTFGKVFLAKHKVSDQPYAIKVISKTLLLQNPSEIRHVMSERNVLRANLQHPFLIGLHYAFQTPTNLYLVLDFVNGGELFFHLQKNHRFDEDRVRFYAAELTLALEYLHSLGIMYRDLKPENILLDMDGHLRLTDFGLAKEHVSAYSRTSTFCGTPEYLAPEIIKRFPYGLAVDWWCLGCVIYEMLVGLPPFYSANPQELFHKILHEKLKFPKHVSNVAKSFIACLLVRSPQHRIHTAAVAKQHDYFRGVDWQKVYQRRYKPPYVPKLASIYDLKFIDPHYKPNKKSPRSPEGGGPVPQESDDADEEGDEEDDDEDEVEEEEADDDDEAQEFSDFDSDPGGMFAGFTYYGASEGEEEEVGTDEEAVREVMMSTPAAQQSSNPQQPNRVFEKPFQQKTDLNSQQRKST